MAFGNKETKEEKQERKAQELLEKYGLQELTDPQDIASDKEIALQLMGNKLVALGTQLGGKPYEGAMLTYMQAVVEQNFIIIRQLERISKK